MKLPPNISRLVTEAEHQKARQWLRDFSVDCIPKDEIQFTFARSSGPGGQNVNKLNTKAVGRLSDIASRAWIAPWSVNNLRQSSDYVARDDALLITSQSSRKQAENIQVCINKFHALIHGAASKDLRNFADPEHLKMLDERVKIARAFAVESKRHRSELKGRNRFE